MKYYYNYFFTAVLLVFTDKKVLNFGKLLGMTHNIKWEIQHYGKIANLKIETSYIDIEKIQISSYEVFFCRPRTYFETKSHI